MVRWSWIVVGALTCAGCGSEPVAEERPFRDDWTQEAQFEFLKSEVDGRLIDLDVSIGGKGAENFANRGDVIVRFDGPPGVMTVEMRRFAMATSEQTARETLDKLELWAYEGRLAHPRDKDADEECWPSWRSGCQLRVFEDSQSQRVVSGADLRITLPPDARGTVRIETEDDSAVSNYLNRGNVCIDGLPGSAVVQMQSGRAFVRLAEDIAPDPTCSPEDVAACEAWTIEDEDGALVPAPWASECPCVANGRGFGQVMVNSRDVDSTDVVVDVPEDLWGSLNLENRLVDTIDRDCEARVDLPESALDLTPSDSPVKIQGLMNYPGYPAVRGAGYSVSLQSGSCGPVGHTEDPGAFIVDGPAASERRGNIQLCSGCMTMSCDDLVP